MIEIDLKNKPLNQLMWSAPVSREDGTELNPATDIGAYHVYYGNVAGDYQNTLEVAGNTLYVDLNFNDVDLPLYAVVTAIDNKGRESLYSAETVFIDGATRRPKPPTDLRVL